MKQKQVKASPKAAKQTKANKKAEPVQKAEEVVEETKEEVKEEVAEKKVVAKKPANKKPAKVQKVVEVVQAPEEEDEEEVEEQVEDEDQDEEAAAEEDVNEEEDEDNDAEENDEDQEMEDDDDEGPEEAGVDEEPTIPSKVKSGQIPATVPSNKIVHVNSLPIKCNKMDIVEVFAKYGAIEQIHITTTPGGTVANVAFKTVKAAKAALADNKKIKVQDSLIKISEHKKAKSKVSEDRERCVYVRLKTGTTEEQLKEHFKECGEIQNVKVMTKFNSTFGFVTFVDKASIEAALELHNSVLNDMNIAVCENNNKLGKSYAEKRTIMVKNKQSFESIDSTKLKDIFSKCGEIEYMDVVCKKNVMAFICYKTEAAAKKALKLNGKTEQDIELETELYDPYAKKTAIHITNLPKDCTEEDLRELFSKAGEIKNVYIKGNFAIIGFENSDAYCKSFLYNECLVKNQIIFVEPYSVRKKSIMKSKLPKKSFQKKGGFKRPAENGNSVFKPKKAKTN